MFFLFITAFLSLLSISEPYDIFIDSSNKSCIQDCDGSPLKPFPNLIDALLFQNSTNSTSFNFYMNPNNAKYKISESNSSQNYFHNFFNTTIIFQPFNCSFQLECVNNDRVQIFIDSKIIAFWVTKKFVLHQMELIANYSSIDKNFTATKALFNLQDENNIEFIISHCVVSGFEFSSTNKPFNYFIYRMLSDTSIKGNIYIINTMIKNFDNLISLIKNENIGLSLNISNTTFINMINITNNLLDLSSNNIIQMSGCSFENIESLIKMDNDSILLIINSYFRNLNLKNISLFHFKAKNRINFIHTIFNNISYDLKSILILNNSNKITLNSSKFSFINGNSSIFHFLEQNEIFLIEFFTLNISLKYEKGIVNLDNFNILSIIDSIFENCVSINGGISHMQSFNNIIIKKSVFLNIRVVNEGGIIYSLKDNMIEVINSLFISNMAERGSLFFLNSEAKVIFNNCSCRNNMARSGSLFYIGSDSTIAFLDIFVKDDKSNYSNKTNGGMIYLDSNNFLNISKSNFYGRSFYDGDYETILRGFFLFANEKNQIKINSVNILNCRVKVEGGCFFLSKNNQATLNNTKIMNSFSKMNGGLIYMDFSNTINMEKVIFKNSRALLEGGFLYLNLANNLIIHNSFFSYGSAKKGGFLKNIKQNTIIFIKSNWIYFNVSDVGGLIDSKERNNSHRISSCRISHASSAFSGFAYFEQYGYVLIDNTIFLNHSATQYAGVMSLGSNIMIKIFNCTFLLCSCSEGSTAVLGSEIENIAISIDLCKFLENDAMNGGTALSLMERSFLYINRSVFINNSGSQAWSDGGCIYINDFNDVIIENSIFKNCSLSKIGGGGVFCFNIANKVILKYNIYQNAVVQCNGAILAAYTENVIFELNSFYHDFQTDKYHKGEQINLIPNGGAIYISESNLVYFLNCSFYNFNVFTGGILCAEIGNFINFARIIIINVNARDSGGIVSLSDLNEIYFEDLIINSVRNLKYGGFMIAQFKNNIKMVNIYILNIMNFGLFGGIFYFENENELHFNASYISNVNCWNYGGIIFSKDSNTILISNSNFSKILTAYSPFNAEGGNILFILNSSFINFNCSLFHGFIYSKENNKIYMNKTNITDIYISGYGYLIYAESFNSFIIWQNIIRNITVSNDFQGIILYFGFLNSLNLSESTISNEFQLKKVDCFYFQSNNSINLHKNFFYIKIGNNFINSYHDNKIILMGNKFDTKCVFLKFLYGNSSSFKLINCSIGFYTNKTLIELLHSKLSIKNLKVLQAEHNFDPYNKKSIKSDLFYFFNSSINLTNVQIIRRNKNDLSLMMASESSLLIKHSLFLTTFKIDKSSEIILLNSHLYSYKNSIIKSFSSSNGGFFYFSSFESKIIKNTSIILIKSIFHLCSTFGMGGVGFMSIDLGILNQKQNYFFSFKSLYSIYKMNKAFSGGVFSFNNISKIILFRNLFRNNSIMSLNKTKISKLHSKGGVVSIMQTATNLLLFNLSENKFLYNFAEIGGVIYVKPYIEAEVLKKNIFEENKAKYFGSIIASTMIDLNFFIQDTLSLSNKTTLIKSLEIDNVISGGNYSYCLVTIVGFDYYGNIGLNLDEDDDFYKVGSLQFRQQLPNLNKTRLSNTIKLSSKRGNHCLSQITRNELPVNESFKYEIIFNRTRKLILSLKFRNCLIGERLTDHFECHSCEPGFYSFQTDFNQPSVCLTCTPDQFFICLGGDRLMPLLGYWRSDKYSMNFLRCNNDDNCVPSNITFYYDLLSAKNNDEYMKLINELSRKEVYEIYTGVCTEGYEGPICDVCSEGYGKMGKTKCVSCYDQAWYYYLINAIQIILKITYLFYCVFMAFRLVFTITLKKANESSIIILNYLKILVIHIQLLSFILKMPFNWSISIKVYLPIVFSFSPDISEAFNFECFMKFLKINLPQQYFLLIFIPIYIILLFLISFLLINIKKSKSVHSIIKSISSFKLSVSIFFIIIILTFVDLCKINFEMFQCINIQDIARPDPRLVNDVTIECESLYHNIWKYALTTPVLVFCFLIMLFILVKMTCSFLKNNLNNNENLIEFVYFHFAYKPNLFFWDFIILIRRLMIMFLFLFFYQDLMAKNIMPIAGMVLVLLVSLALHIFLQPFKVENDILNRMEENSLIVLLFSYIAALMYGTFYFSENRIEIKYVLLTISFIIIANGIFIIHSLKYYYQYYLKKRIKSLKRVLNRMGYNDPEEFLIKEHEFLINLKNDLIVRNYLADWDSFYQLNSKEESKCFFPFFIKKILIPLDFNPNINEESTFDNAPDVAYDIDLKLENLKKCFVGESFSLFKENSNSFELTCRRLLKGKTHYLSYLRFDISLRIQDKNQNLKNYSGDQSLGNTKLIKFISPFRYFASFI